MINTLVKRTVADNISNNAQIINVYVISEHELPTLFSFLYSFSPPNLYILIA